MKKQSIITLSFIAIFFIGLFMTACQLEDSTGTGILEYDEGNPADFVNGYNQKYLKQLSMTEEQLLAKIKQQYIEEADNNLSTREIDGNVIETILGSMKNYIDINICTEILSGRVYLGLGFNYSAIDRIISPLSYRVKDTKFNKIDIGQFKLKSASNNVAVFTFEARVRHYEKVLWKYVKLLDKTGTGEIVLRLSCDSSTNEIKMSFEIRRFNIETSFWQDLMIIVCPIGFITNTVVNNITENKVNDTKIEYTLDMGFIPVQYLSLQKCYFSTKNGDKFFYFNFRLKVKNMLNDILDKIRKKGFSFKKYNVSNIDSFYIC
jgi:hypothetical protein